jgi:hypothetical protein
VAYAMGVLARRLGCDIETDVPLHTSAGKHAPWPQFCDLRPLQLAISLPSACPSFNSHSLSRSAKPQSHDSPLFHRSSVARSDCGAEVGAADDEHEEEEEEEEEEERPLAHQVDATLALALAVTEPQLSVR